MKYSIVTILMFVLVSSLQGQDRQQMRDRLESQKVAYITTELDLTTEEAQKFWPIYNEYESKRAADRQKRRMPRSKSGVEHLTEEEAAQAIEEMLTLQEQEIKLKRSYAEKLLSAISARKIARLFMLEKQFKEQLLSKIRKKMRRRGVDRDD